MMKNISYFQTHIAYSINQIGTDEKTQNIILLINDDTMGLRDDEDMLSTKMMKILKTAYINF